MKMRNSLSLRVFSLCVSIWTVGNSGDSHAQDAWETRIRAEYSEAVLHWNHLLANVACEVHEISGKRELNYRLFSKDDASGFTRSEMTPEGVLKKIYVWTPESTFRLESPPKTEGFRIAGAKTAAVAGTDFARTRVPMIFESDTRLKSMIQVLDIPVSEMLDIARLGSTEVDYDGRKLPQFQFDYSGLESNFNTVTVTLDPENHWGLIAWTADFKPTTEGISRTTAEITYDVLPGDLGSFPKTIREVVSLIAESETKELRVRTTTLSNVQFGVVEDSEFLMESYGVPDVLKPPTNSRYPFDSITFWCALAVGVVTLAMLWRVRRQGQQR